VDELDEPLQMLDRGGRQHAVTEVEHVAPAAARAAQDVARPRLDDVPRREEHRRIEVALDRATREARNDTKAG
jgi:hypothetical protein